MPAGKKVTTNNLSRRSLGREYAFKFIYKLFLSDFLQEKKDFLSTPQMFESAIHDFDLSYNEEDHEHPDNFIDSNTKSFAKELILGVLNSENKNSAIIESFLTNQNLKKVDRMNLAVLLLGTYEILNDKESSPGIFINEYVNLAKKYCPNDAHGFINSILDKIAKAEK